MAVHTISAFLVYKTSEGPVFQDSAGKVLQHPQRAAGSKQKDIQGEANSVVKAFLNFTLFGL